MKKNYFLAIVLLFVFTYYSKAQVTVTIKVDMSGLASFDPATQQLDYAGSFDGWAAFHPLTIVEGSIYSVTFTDVTKGYYGGDIYLNDKGSPAWGT
jgi:hypothetical protein